MDSTIVMVNLFGSVALLLFGLAQVKDGVFRAFGARLKAWLAASTRGGFRSFAAGVAATVALQSSTATSMILASFVERELVKPRMAQIVLLGANVGTALTAWLVAIGVEWLSPLVILTGIVFYRSNSIRRQGGGAALIGIGLMLLSLHLLANATEPMRQSQALIGFVGLLDNAWPVALIFSAGIAFISSSSLAAIVAILSLSDTGTISPELTIVLVLGANLGGAIPPVVASMGLMPSAKRLTLGNMIVRGVGCVLVLPLAGPVGHMLDALPFLPTKLPVDAHLGFNLALAVVAWPFSAILSRWMLRLVPDDPSTDNGPRYLDERQLTAPVIAIAGATREALGVGDLIERMLINTSEAFEQGDTRKLEEIAALEMRVDRLQQGSVPAEGEMTP